MCALTFAALVGLATGCAQGVPTSIPAADDPRTTTYFRPPPSPLAGLKPYQPVEARADWGLAPPTRLPQHGKTGGTMPGMKGMSMPGMSMPDMDMGGKR